MRMVPGHPGYFATESGDVYSVRTGAARLLKTRDNRGYLVVNFTVGSGRSKYRKRMPVHRVVALAFLGLPPAGRPYCCHRNGDSKDNRVDNLYWGSPKDNVKDAIRHGTYGFGEKAPNCRVDDLGVALIRRRRIDGVPVSDLAKSFGLSEGYIYQLCSGRYRMGGGTRKP